MNVIAVRINGASIPLVAARLLHAGHVKKPVHSGQDLIGFTQRAIAAGLILIAGVEAIADIRKLLAVSDAQIRATLDTGEELLMRGASNRAPPIIGQAGVSIAYTGRNWQDVTVAA